MRKVLCLGFFDCIHLGHRALIKRAKELAYKNLATVELITFDDNFFEELGQTTKEIFTAIERRALLYSLGITRVQFLPAEKSLFDMEPNDFLDMVTNKDEIVAIVVGKDYTYGKNASGNLETLSNYCKMNGLLLDVIDLVEDDSGKISSSVIRTLITSGNIAKANILLNGSYFIMGEVIHGRGAGGQFSIPTANLDVEEPKLLPQCGVYHTQTVVDGNIYCSLTNVGSQPTFERETVTVETMLKDFKEDIYGKTITVNFIKKIRDIRKFDTPDELVKQIHKDFKEVAND